MPTKPLSKAKRDRVVHLLGDNKLRHVEIATKVGVGTGTVSKIAMEIGKTRRTSDERKERNAKVHQLAKLGLSVARIAKEMGLGEGSVLAIVRNGKATKNKPVEFPAPHVSRYVPFVITDPGSWLILCDVHVPCHDEATVKAAIRDAKKSKAVGVIINGDFLDCVTPDTRVLTWDLRWVPAGELKIGDRLIGFDEELAAVTETTKRGRGQARRLRESFVESNRIAPQEILALHMEDGTVFRCSPGHRLLGWKSAKPFQKALEWLRADEIMKRLSEGRDVVLNSPVKPWETEMEKDYDAGYIAGAFDGEGCVTFHKNANNFGNLHFTQRRNGFLDSVEAALHRKGFETYRNHYEPRGTAQLKIKGGMWEHASFIGRFDVPRFRKKWVATAPVGGYTLAASRRQRVVRVVSEGIGDVVVLQTSSKTYISEGLCSHNCHELSDHEKDPSLPRYVDEVEAGQKLLGWIRRELPDARIVYKLGNHEERLQRYIMARAAAFVDLEAVTIAGMLKFRDYDIEEVKDKRVIQLGKLHVLHGHEYRGGGGVSPARWLYLKARSRVLCGHFHRTSDYHGKNVGQRFESAWSVGCACDLHPSYAPLNEWNNGYAMVDLDKDGDFTVRNMRVLDGKVY